MADTYTTSTTAAAFIPEVWSQEVVVARESRLVLAGLVSRWDKEVMNFGDIINIPSLANLAAGDISTSDGTLAASTNTEGTQQLTVNKWKGCVVNIVDIVAAQANQSMRDLYSKKIGYALGLIVEQDLAALAASLSQTYGTFNTDTVTDAILRNAVQALDDARVPFADRHGFFKPALKNAMLGIDKFVRYDSIAYPKGESPTLRGNLGEVYGVSMNFSPEVYSSINNDSNMIFHRECFGLAMQKGVKMTQFAKTAWTDRVGGSELYGVKEIRDDHGVEIRS